MSSGPLLLIGLRTGVLPALRKLARPAFALVGSRDAMPSWPELAGVARVDLHGPAESLKDAAHRLVGTATPAAIAALAERTVVVAARLRSEWGLPGNREETALRCADKVVMKRAMEAADIPVARWREVDGESDPRELVEALGLPIVLKPRRDSGGRGQVVVRDADDLSGALAGLPALSTGWLAEGWIEGTEMSVESFVLDGRVLFANPTEYLVVRHANVLPAELPARTWTEVRAFVERALRAAGVSRGITHLELFRTPNGLVFGELAARPPGGRLMPLLQRAYGFDPWEALLRLELGEEVAFPAHARRVAGVWVLHPGEGRVREIRGLDEVRAQPLVRRILLRVGPGDSIARREGSGQDIGYMQVEGPDRGAVADALFAAREALEIELET